jgi:hypothetical protein
MEAKIGIAKSIHYLSPAGYEVLIEAGKQQDSAAMQIGENQSRATLARAR